VPPGEAPEAAATAPGIAPAPGADIMLNGGRIVKEAGVAKRAPATWN
jgi:hypothetical protein